MEIICVTGMHRSGTSALARIVNLLGVYLGEEEDMLPKRSANARGFWEIASISSLNEWVLKRMGGTWDEPPALFPGWEHSQELDEIRVHAINTLKNVLGTSEPIGFKDPRTSLTLPFWRTVVTVRTTIMSLRHPAEVAESLRNRYDFDTERSAGLWLRYVVTSFLADPSRLVVPFTDLLAELEPRVSGIAEHLSLPPPTPALMEAIAEFVEPGLKHHTVAEVPPGPQMARATTVFTLLRDESTHRNAAPLLEEIESSWDDSKNSDSKFDHGMDKS